MMLETLENRQLMSVSLDPASHVLTVTGTDSADVIVVKMNNGQLQVSDNGAVKKFDPAKVSKVKVLAKAGGDHVTVDANVTKSTELHSGTGGPGMYEDVLQGGSGKDTIYLESFFAEGNGGAGDDKLIVSFGETGANGGAGNDVIVVKDSAAASENSFIGGPGIDAIDFSDVATGMIIQNGTSGYYYADSGEPPVMVGFATDSVNGMENLIGTKGADWIYGTDGDNLLRGGAGDDHLFGGKGNDTLVGDAGKDAMFGQEGNDKFFANDGLNDFISGGFGTDKAKFDGADVVTGIEGVIV